MDDRSSISTTVFGIGGEVRPLKEALATIAESGFPQVEISRKHDDLKKLTKWLKQFGLTCWAVHGTLGGDAISPDESKRRACVGAEFKRMDASAEAGPVPYVVHYLDRHTDPSVQSSFRKSIEEVLEHAAALKLNLAVETAPDKPSNERYPASAEIAEFVRSLDHPNASICIDLNHSNLGEPLPQSIANCAGLVSTVHVSDNFGQSEGHLVPGHGVIDFERAFRMLDDGGYTGPINLEVHLDEFPTVQDLKDMKAWCDTMLSDLRTGEDTP